MHTVAGKLFVHLVQTIEVQNIPERV